jgi:hypothetical protein
MRDVEKIFQATHPLVKQIGDIIADQPNEVIIMTLADLLALSIAAQEVAGNVAATRRKRNLFLQSICDMARPRVNEIAKAIGRLES